MKILLDPLMYWFPNNSEKQINLLYLEKATSIIEKYFDIKYISSQFFIKTLQRLNKEPFSTNKEQDALRSVIIKRLLRNLDYPNNIDNPICDNYLFPDDFKATNYKELDDYFAKIVNYLVTHDIPCLLFLARLNHVSSTKSINQLFVVKNISGEINSKITELIHDGTYLKAKLPEPDLKKPLPFFDLCDHFLTLQNEMSKNDDSMSVFLRITKEVAYRNRYKLDDTVTNKNNTKKHKRKIYTYNKTHYISTDFESGCFELFDYRGRHMGEISYIGTKISSPDKTGKHDIKI